jgi:serine/threonine protein kinase
VAKISDSVESRIQGTPGATLATGLQFFQSGGTLRWCAPEVISSGHFQKPSDVWSFGLVLWEMFNTLALKEYRMPYFETQADSLVAKSIVEKDRIPDFEGSESSDLALGLQTQTLNQAQQQSQPQPFYPPMKELIKLILNFNPSERPTFGIVVTNLEQMLIRAAG